MKYGQCHDIPNLYISGAPVFVTSGGANPTETVMALAAWTADHIIDKKSKGKLDREETDSDRRTLAHAR